MKISSQPPGRPAPRRSSAGTCVIINQLATPGLGSIIAGRRIAGFGQLFVALIGFGMIMGWFVQLFLKTYRLLINLPEEPAPYPWLGKVGGLIFLAAWLWAWITSLSVLRQARRSEDGAAAATAAANVPPRIT